MADDEKRPFYHRHLSALLVLGALVLFAFSAVIFNLARGTGAPGAATVTGASTPNPPPVTTARDLALAATRAMEQAGTYRVSYQPNDPARFDPFEGVVSLAGGSASLDLTVKRAVQPGGPLQDFRFVSTGSVVFVRLPAVFQAPAGKPWARLSRDGKDDVSTMLLAAFDLAAESAVPSANWLELLSAAGQLTSSTRTEAGGTQVTRYTLNLDLDRSASRLNTPRLAGARKLDVELDLDARNLPVGLSITTPGRPVTEHISYTAWAQPVTITPPPPTEIHDR
jgi:hypothetical protein